MFLSFQIKADVVEMFTVFIHPYIGHSHKITTYDIKVPTWTSGEWVREARSEHVSNTWTGKHFNGASTHPDLEAYEMYEHSLPCINMVYSILEENMSGWYIVIGNYTYPKGYFKIFSTPNIHSSVVSSYFFKVTSINREQTPSHDWGPEKNKTIVSCYLRVSGKPE